MTDQSSDHTALMKFTTEIISAHVSNNAVAANDLPAMIEAVFTKLSDLGNPPVEPEVEQKPAVPVKRSVQDDHLVCLECGKKMKMLKRHISTDHGQTPGDYRAKWSLGADYPMVSPAYSATRQELAKRIGLGRKPADKPKPVRGRKKAVVG